MMMMTMIINDEHDADDEADNNESLQFHINMMTCVNHVNDDGDDSSCC